VNNFEIHEEVKVEDLREGDMIDLENDEYADPFGFDGTESDPEEGDDEANHMALEYEYACVEGANVVKYDLADVVQVYTDKINVDFPVGHLIKRLIPDAGQDASLVVDGQAWADPDGRIIFTYAEALDLRTRLADRGYTDVKVEYLDQ
jgi:hypothetical protein